MHKSLSFFSSCSVAFANGFSSSATSLGAPREAAPMACGFRSSSFAPPSPCPCLNASSRFSPIRRPMKLKPYGVKKNLVACGASGEGKGRARGFKSISDKAFAEEKIGAEYGEGFETFRMDGPLKVDVNYLNDKLQECFLQRIRHAMKPDESIGLIFSWDNVVAETRSLKLDAWRQLAYEEDDMLRKILCWEETEGELERLKSRLSKLYYDNLLKLDAPVGGLIEWLDALYSAGIPCAIVSCLDRRYMIDALQKMGLNKYFQAIVTEVDGMESIAHRFLSAAMKLDRKPSKCVVFEDDPRGITAAHNCTMKVVALIGAHPAYELVQADLAVASFNELSVINLRRLFAHSGSDFMDLQKQFAEKSPPRRKLRTDAFF